MQFDAAGMEAGIQYACYSRQRECGPMSEEPSMNPVTTTGLIAITLLAAGDLLAEGKWEGTGFSGDFTETTVDEDGTETQSGRLFMDERGVRMEMSNEGEAMVMIMRFEENEIITVMPAEEAYMKMPFAMTGQGTTARIEDQFTGPCAEYAKREKLGDETVNGRSTEKWRCEESTDLDADAFEWYDSELGIPVRSEDDEGGRFDLTNIKTGSQPAALFEPPSDYSLIDMGAMMRMQMQRGEDSE